MSNNEEKKLITDAMGNEVLAYVEIRDEENTLCYEHYEVEPDLGAPENPLAETVKPNAPVTYTREKVEQNQKRADAERAVRRYLGSKASLNADFVARIPGRRYHVDVFLYASAFWPVRPEWHEIVADREYENILVPAPDPDKAEPVTYRGPFALKPGERVVVARIYGSFEGADPYMSQEAAADCGNLVATEVFVIKPGMASYDELYHAAETFTHDENRSSYSPHHSSFKPREDGTAAVFSTGWNQYFHVFSTNPDAEEWGYDLQTLIGDEDNCLEPERDYYYGPLLQDNSSIYINVQKYSTRTGKESETYAFQNKLPTQYRFDARHYSAQEAVDFAVARFCDTMHIDFREDKEWHAVRERTCGWRPEAVVIYKDNGASVYQIAPMDCFGDGSMDAGNEEFFNDDKTNVLKWDVYAYCTPDTYPLGRFAPVPSEWGVKIIEAPTARAAETEARLESDPEITTRNGYIFRAVRHGRPKPDTPKTPDALIDWGYFSN